MMPSMFIDALEKPQMYKRDECAVFLYTTDQFGGLSNFAKGMPISVEGVKFLTSEHLFQAMKFPYYDDIQKWIVEAKTAKEAKAISDNHPKKVRSDWHNIKIDVMAWVLQMKLLHNRNKFSYILDDTENKSIVEQSFKSDYWGAIEKGDTLYGANVLGKLLMKLRSEFNENGFPEFIPALEITDHKIYNWNIGAQGV